MTNEQRIEAIKELAKGLTCDERDDLADFFFEASTPPPTEAAMRAVKQYNATVLKCNIGKTYARPAIQIDYSEL